MNYVVKSVKFSIILGKASSLDWFTHYKNFLLKELEMSTIANCLNTGVVFSII